MKYASTLSAPETMRSSATPSRVFRIAVSTAFGLPFLYSLETAWRGELFAGRYYFFGGASSVATFLAWVVVSALGSLWLGVSLRVGLFPRVATRLRDPLAAALMLAGVAALLFSARLLTLRAGA